MQRRIGPEEDDLQVRSTTDRIVRAQDARLSLTGEGVRRIYLIGYITNGFNTTMNDSISSTFAALADPTRRAILARLALGETSVTELAEPFAISMPAVSKHLRVLERAGLIVRSREAQWRPCKLKAEPLRQAAGWLDEYRRFWEESFDRLDEYLQRVQAEQKQTKGRKKPKKETRYGRSNSK
jgi:DNA-binding transcriptional ArsR family regulator